jgi:HEAT repeat protein
MRKLTIGVVVMLFLQPQSVHAGMVEEWDTDEAKRTREVLFPEIAHLSDGAMIRLVFEKSLTGDASAIPGLVALLSHSNEEVATRAAMQLGTFQDPSATAALKGRLGRETRSAVKAASLVGLGRMRDPQATSLAIQALSDPDIYMEGAGGLALGLIGDSRNTPALLAYLDEREKAGGPDTGAFDILAELGDPPGSTAVRDRLLAEANNKAYDFDDIRIEAAHALWKMGQGSLVQHILDREDAKGTRENILTLRGIITRLAALKGLKLDGQTALEGALSQVKAGNDRNDMWDRPLRVQYVSPGVFNVVSDGPDKTPGTADDLSTAEPFEAYDQRIFGDLF